MASNPAKEARIKAVVAAILAEEEAMDGVDFEHENINDIEDAMIRIGDLVAREVGIQKLVRHTRQVGEPKCPTCGTAGEPLGEQSRQLVTRRGKVPVTEAKYRCPQCRRHFFPSDRPAGN
jgi:hypothetical protein